MRLWAGLTLTLALATGSVWVWAAEPEPVQVQSIDGETLFLAKGCVGCHQRGSLGHVSVGPNLIRLGERATEEYVRDSITDPQAYRVSGFEGIDMPTLDLTDAELDALVEFLLSDA